MSNLKDEILKITLQIEGEEAKNKLAILEKSAADLRKKLDQVPKGSAEWAQFNRELAANEAVQKKVRGEIGLTGLTLKQLSDEARQLKTALFKTFTEGTPEFANASKRLQEVRARIKEVTNEMNGLDTALETPQKKGVWNKMVTGVNLVKTAMSAFLALAVVQKLFEWGQKIFDVTAKFEKYQTVLKTALGSEKEAHQSMAALRELAAKTAFGVDELTDGYVKMVNRGLRPSKAEMINLADLAASQGKSFDQLTEAVLDAMGAEFERLKEFGARGKKAGETLELSFKNVPYVIKNTGSEFQILEKSSGKLVESFSNQEDAVVGVMTAFGKLDGVAGQNAEMMQTLEGKTSNLGDSFESLMLELGTGLRPVFLSILTLFEKSIPTLAVLGKAVGTVIIIAKELTIGLYQTTEGIVMALYKVGVAAVELVKGNMDAAKFAYAEAKAYGDKFNTSMSEAGNRARKEIAGLWVNPEAAIKAELAGKKEGDTYQGALTEAQKKAAEKRQKEKEKALEKAQKIEKKHLDDVKKDNEKALELLAQLESEHDTQVATTSLEKEEAKIEEKRRKRLKEINDSLADEKNKEAAREAINRNAEEAISQVRAQYRDKQYKADAEAAAKRLAAENFIRDQERSAEMALLDWKEIQARGNATKLAAIKKERANTELRYTQEKLQAELIAEQAKAATEIQDTETLANTLQAIEERIHAQSVAAEAKTAEAKKQIDADLRKQKEENLRGYSDMFNALLQGDLSAFASAASGVVSGHKNALQERLTADMGYYQMGADMANQAVSFLNDLAQRKAEKAIAEANRERDEKVAILNNELAVTESMISSHSAYVQALKTAEKDRLAQLQAALTSETTTEEEKRQAMLKFYSEQFQQMKEAEEQKITDLQRLANMAKTEDEKRAIEEKIRLAENESAEKIRLAEEELEAKKQAIQDVEDFTAESSASMLDEAKAASDKQLEMAEHEAVQKMEFKEDLEETIAAENRKARATEAAEKKKAWEAQKKADIATALITGALAVLKALANFFPLNIILAASAAVLTGVQVAKIKNQSPPAFEHGGFVAKGGAHGPRYSDGGIALIDRASGREVGEMEGDEAIISKEQTAANWPIIQKMFANARTPGLKNTPVAGLPAFAHGGFVSPYWQKEMYLFGTKKRKAKQDALMAEQEAKEAQKDADAYAGSVEFDASGVPSGDTSGFAESADAQAAHEAAQRQGEEQIKTLKGILEASEANGEAIAELGNVMLSVKDSVNAVRAAVDENTGATRGVEGAVRGNHNNHLLNEIMSRISALAA